MPVSTSTLGPGTLTLGPVATPVDVSCQVISAQVEVSMDKDDDETTLCGDVVAGDSTFTATLSGSVFQDLASATGLVAYSWENMGTTVEFEYIPNTADAAKVAGDVIVQPITVGGDEPKKRMRSDFEWQCVGVPTFTPGAGAAAAEAEADELAGVE